jgi:hypothetical protein
MLPTADEKVFSGRQEKLIADFLADSNTLYRYDVGRLALWVPKDSPLDLAKLGMRARNVIPGSIMNEAS